jgi:hypothetical protein
MAAAVAVDPPYPMKTKTKITLRSGFSLCTLDGGMARGGGTPDEMRLRVTDPVSGIQFLELIIDPGELMRALTGSTVQAQFELNATHLIGMKHEQKTELIPFDCFDGSATRVDGQRCESHQRTDAMRKALAPFEHDGWKGRGDDLLNMHNRVGGRHGEKTPKQKVSFTRFVHPRTGHPVKI